MSDEEDVAGLGRSPRRHVPFDPLVEPTASRCSFMAARAIVQTLHSDCILQFSASTFYCVEGDRKVVIEVVRFGDLERVTTCSYETSDATGKAGVRYVAQSGTLRFQCGEALKEIVIEIIENETWDSILEFNMTLTDPENAQLGKYLHKCRVTVIDDDSFPTNKFQADIEAGKVRGVNGASLMIEFFKMSWQDAQVKRDTVFIVSMDLIKSLYFFLTLYLTMYLVDVVLAPPEELNDRRLLRSIRGAARILHESFEHQPINGDELMMHTLLVPHHRRYTAMVIAALYVLPFVFLHIIDFLKCHLKLPGCTRKLLKANLLRKYLYYREDIRRCVNTSQLMMAMMRDISAVVDFGYMTLLQAIRRSGRLLLAMLFIVAENKMAIFPMVVYPFALGLFLYCREALTLQVHSEKAEKEDVIVQVVSDTVYNYDLIADFALTTAIVDGYERRIEEFHVQENIAGAVRTNNLYIAPWLTTLTIGAFIVVGSTSVDTVGGTLTLGAFLATLNVFKEIGEDITEIYREVQEMQQSIGPLRKITHFLNLQTDLELRMQVNRKRHKQGRHYRDALKQLAFEAKPGRNETRSFVVDKVKIIVSDLSFSYPTGDPVLRNLSQEFEQGKLYAFIGPSKGGKTTFLKLLGQVLIPEQALDDDDESVFIPPHLRILHVAHMSNVLAATTLLSNILLTDTLQMAGGLKRVKAICKRLGMSKYLLELLDDDTEPPDEPGLATTRFPQWSHQLSHTDCSRIKLARILVLNPECLVLHKPAETFDELERRRVLSFLREHVDDRGLELPSSEKGLRRARTVFFSCTSSSGLQYADAVFDVSKEVGLRRVSERRTRLTRRLDMEQLRM
eukprot:TRINITY_DN51190_c0_g1_i1.p1 TRINITY_DN51190_c0_g1~~TRINITY_DN51190_c0_g1_i1.p1  ORF type:complete len:847 (+),score=135.48 TRINITY_DN51190_c0_g1_i1:235-2775(+)